MKLSNMDTKIMFFFFLSGFNSVHVYTSMLEVGTCVWADSIFIIIFNIYGIKTESSLPVIIYHLSLNSIYY